MQFSKVPLYWKMFQEMYRLRDSDNTFVKTMEDGLERVRGNGRTKMELGIYMLRIFHISICIPMISLLSSRVLCIYYGGTLRRLPQRPPALQHSPRSAVLWAQKGVRCGLGARTSAQVRKIYLSIHQS